MASRSQPDTREPTYSLGAVARLTGLSPHVLRAWERRHGVVQPLRSSGGTRRYRESDVERLRLLSAAVAAGDPIGVVAGLSDEELARRASRRPEPSSQLAPLLEALEHLDGEEAERLLGVQLAGLGPLAFAEQVVSPLLREVGERWSQGRFSVAAEHLATSLVRNLLGSVLRRRAGSENAGPVLFATPPEERHELGTLVQAVVAAEAGAQVVYLGADLPVDELAGAAERLRARAVALGVSCLDEASARRAVEALRRELPAEVDLWVGGDASAALDGLRGVERIADTEALQRKLRLLTERRG